MKKKIIAVTLLALVFISLPMSASAHSSPQSLISWGESIGWSISEDYHSNGSTIYYKFDSSDTYISSYKTYVTGGASLWSGTVTISESSSAIGTIKTYSNTASTIVAATYKLLRDSSNHLTLWSIELNRAQTQSSKVLAHEFGHVIGLNDLSNSTNKDKLMYYSSTGHTATKPASADIKGAKVILGLHSSHTWSYKRTVTGIINQHDKYCTVCDGFVVENCTYVTNKICTKCGVQKIEPLKIELSAE